MVEEAFGCRSSPEITFSEERQGEVGAEGARVCLTGDVDGDLCFDFLSFNPGMHIIDVDKPLLDFLTDRNDRGVSGDFWLADRS